MTAETQPEVKVDDCGELLTPGGYLQKARESKQWDVKEVAGKLRITRAKLAALESDSYDQFPGETFIRGYFRSYARLLDLDEDAVLQRYTDYVAAHSEVSQLIAPNRAFGVSGNVDVLKAKPALGQLIIVAISLVLVAIIVWLLVNPKEERAAAQPVPAATAVIDSAPADQDLPAVEEPSVAEPEGPEAVTNSGLNTDPADEALAVQLQSAGAHDGSEPAALVSSAENSAPTVDARTPDVLELTFSDECWVEVSDANGDVLATELQSVGSALSLRGKAPFNVMLGNAKAVTVTLNGQPIDATPKGNNRALRFVVGQSN